MSGIRGAGPSPVRRLVLDRYALLERFQGGMAEVWKAHDQRLDRMVVAKFLRVTDRGTHPALRFLREAKILAAIDDPRIVRVHDVDEARIDGSWHLYLITQYVEGRPCAPWSPRATGWRWPRHCAGPPNSARRWSRSTPGTWSTATSSRRTS